jgi:RNA polymerase sigma-70 factor (ECF subfamily)
MSKLGTLGTDDPTLDDQAVEPTVEHVIATVDDAPTLESLYALHAESLARALHAAGVPDANDAVQEAFVQAVVHWRKVSRYDDPLAWIRRVAINRGHNRRRSRRRQQALAEHIVAMTTAPVPAAESDDEIQALVESLPPQQRLALSLYYYADLSVAEVADAMKLSAGAVKYHLHAARTSLSRSLEIRDDS